MHTKQDVLQACQIEGTIIKLPAGQLDRKLYVEVAKALELIGGKWKGGKIAGFVFPEDPTELLAQIANGDARNLKKEFQFFATPDHIADMLVLMAEPKAGHTILEPSAGNGAIIKAITRYNPQIKQVHCCELMPTNQTQLKKVDKAHLIGEDFLQLTDCEKKFDIIIANPPFTKNQDINHVQKMYWCLKPGGRLVSVMSKHWQQCDNKREIDFREWIQEVKARLITIPAGAFKESGTMIETVAVIIQKPDVKTKGDKDQQWSFDKGPQPSSHQPKAGPSKPAIILQALKVEVYPPNAFDLSLKYFINGGRIHPDALQSLFGNKKGKSVEAERKARFTWCAKDGSTIDQLAHYLWQENIDLDRDENIETSDFREAIEQIILSYTSVIQMAKDLVAKYNPQQQVPDIVEEVQVEEIPLPKQKRQKRHAEADPVPENKPEIIKLSPRDPVPPLPDPVQLEILPYSDRSIALIGQTKPIRQLLRQLNGKYCPNIKIEGQTVNAWIFSKKRENQIKQLINA